MSGLWVSGPMGSACFIFGKIHSIPFQTGYSDLSPPTLGVYEQ